MDESDPLSFRSRITVVNGLLCAYTHAHVRMYCSHSVFLENHQFFSVTFILLYI